MPQLGPLEIAVVLLVALASGPAIAVAGRGLLQGALGLCTRRSRGMRGGTSWDCSPPVKRPRPGLWEGRPPCADRARMQ